MIFEVRNHIDVFDPDARIYQWAHDNLVIRNPDFYKKQAMGKWTGDTPEFIWLYEVKGRDLELPFGVFSELWGMYPDPNLWSNCIVPDLWPVSIDYQSRIKPYEYQEDAVQKMLEKKNGVLIMPCGSGKTQVGLEIIAKVGAKALWLTHTGDLLRQSKKRAESVYGIDKKTFGEITAGRVNIGESITFATVQTMCGIELEKYKNEWNVVIVDECQHCAGSPTKVTQFYKVVSSLCARYKIGLTATLSRSDGLERAVTALLGSIAFEVDRECVADTTCPIKVEWVETGYTPDVDEVTQADGTLDYMKMCNALVENDDRFVLVVKKINSLSMRGVGGILVLGNRVEYLQQLQEHFFGKSVCLSGMGQSKKAKAERKAALEQLNNGELDCIFATYQLAAEGLDVPNLRYVVMATPEKNERTVVQAAGRVGRNAPGKDHGTVIDFVDDFSMYRGWAKKRRRYYEKLGE